MKNAVLYEQLEDNRVRCNLCAHRCTIFPGNRGICAVRENRKGKLYSLNYGKVIAANVDPIEKKPLFHFLPGTKSYSIATAGCNFRCEFCQNWDISQLSKTFKSQALKNSSEPGSELAEFPGFDLPPEKIVSEAVKNDCASIAYTYTEPTIFFEYAHDSAKLARERGLKNIFITNGYQTPETIKKMIGLIDAANVDLKSFVEFYYHKVCGAHLQPVLDAIKLMYKKGIWLEITTLIVPKLNDSDKELTQIAEFIAQTSENIPWHVSRFHPNYKMTDSCPTPIETLHKAVEIGKKAGLNFIYAGNIPGDKYEKTYCPNCGEVVIDRWNYSVQNFLENGKCPKCGSKIPLIYE